MIKRILYLAGMLLLLARIQTFAQSLGELPLAKAWEIGLASYPGLTESQAQRNAAAYQKQVVKNKFLPQLHAQLQNTYGTYAGSTGAFFPLPGIFNVSGSPASDQPSRAATGLYGSVLMDWKVFEFGRRTKELQAASLQQQVAEVRYSAAELATKARISALYLDILYHQANAGWAKTNARRMQQVLALAKSLSQAGIKPGADTLFVLSAYSQTLADSRNWEGKAKASKIQLTEVLAVPADSFALPQKSYLSAAPLPPAQADSSAHPYLQVLERQVKLAEVQRQFANRKLFPSLSVLGGLSGRASSLAADGAGSSWSGGTNSQAINYVAGVALTWNITAAFNSRLEGRLAGQNTLASQARYQVQALKQQTTLRALAARLTHQQEQIADARQAVAHARQAYAGYLARYESGLISMTELLQLQFLLQQAEKSRIEAYRQFWDQLLEQAELSGDFSYLSTQF